MSCLFKHFSNFKSRNDLPFLCHPHSVTTPLTVSYYLLLFSFSHLLIFASSSHLLIYSFTHLLIYSFTLYRPKNCIPIPLSRIIAPATRCIYRSALPRGIKLIPRRVINTTVSIVSIVVMAKQM